MWEQDPFPPPSWNDWTKIVVARPKRCRQTYRGFGLGFGSELGLGLVLGLGLRVRARVKGNVGFKNEGLRVQG